MFSEAKVQGAISSTGTVSGVYERQIDAGFTLKLSGEIDYVRNEYRFGFGVTLG